MTTKGAQPTKFRKKPIVIEAIQFNGSRESHIATCAFIGNQCDPERPLEIAIVMLEGEMRVSVGDWIIRGVKGEFYPCKPDIFAATYDPVEGAQHSAGAPSERCSCGQPAGHVRREPPRERRGESTDITGAQPSGGAEQFYGTMLRSTSDGDLPKLLLTYNDLRPMFAFAEAYAGEVNRELLEALEAMTTDVEYCLERGMIDGARDATLVVRTNKARSAIAKVRSKDA